MPLIIIVGPTAIGKSRLAIKIAKKIKGEIISADSMQVYRLMPILSQAPSFFSMQGVPHYLVNILNPKKEYNVAVFRDKAERIIDDIIRRNKIPIVVGGSGLYVKALVDGLFPTPAACDAFRARLRKLASRYGNSYLYKKLVRFDPKAARKIHPNDSRRIIRALEIRHLTGKSMSELKPETKGLRRDYRIKMFGLTAPRDIIYERINRRVDQMFDDGVVKEIKRLIKKSLSKTARAILGLKEILGYTAGEYGLETAKEKLKMNTRRFAKRQLTWFRADKRIRWFDITKKKDGEIVKEIQKR